MIYFNQMIKIEFKEAQSVWQNGLRQHCLFVFTLKPIEFYGDIIKVLFDWHPDYKTFKSDSIKSVKHVSISELVPDRSEILKQLGISQQEDEQNQIKCSKL